MMIGVAEDTGGGVTTGALPDARPVCSSRPVDRTFKDRAKSSRSRMVWYRGGFVCAWAFRRPRTHSRAGRSAVTGAGSRSRDFCTIRFTTQRERAMSRLRRKIKGSQHNARKRKDVKQAHAILGCHLHSINHGSRSSLPTIRTLRISKSATFDITRIIKLNLSNVT